MAYKNLVKDFQSLLKNIEKVTDGQAGVVEWNPDDLTSFVVEIRPNGGYYEGGKIQFKIDLSGHFPTTPPGITCLTKIYHPNIDTTDDFSMSNVCLNMLDTEFWEPTFGLEGCVLGLLFLLYNPNIYDTVSPLFAFFEPSEEVFADNVKRSLRGDAVDGQYFMGFEKDEKTTSLDRDNQAEMQMPIEGNVFELPAEQFGNKQYSLSSIETISPLARNMDGSKVPKSQDNEILFEENMSEKTIIAGDIADQEICKPLTTKDDSNSENVSKGHVQSDAEMNDLKLYRDGEISYTKEEVIHGVPEKSEMYLQNENDFLLAYHGVGQINELQKDCPERCVHFTSDATSMERRNPAIDFEHIMYNRIGCLYE